EEAHSAQSFFAFKMTAGNSTSPVDFLTRTTRMSSRLDFLNSDGMQQEDPYSKRESEVDMLVGFFLMNGFCVVFFLLFGMCVIFSCMRKRPRFMRADSSKKLNEVTLFPATPEPTPIPAPKPLFKTLVTKALRTTEFQNLKKAPVVQCNSDGEPTLSNKQSSSLWDGNGMLYENRIQMSLLKSPTTGRKSVRRERVVVEDLSTPETSKSVIRQNLLGPLTFDDLYYT
ncbi:hypothetical protein PFISCL1PPCAC_127, partial [Pristionchus fissidentatus]